MKRIFLCVHVGVICVLFITACNLPISDSTQVNVPVEDTEPLMSTAESLPEGETAVPESVMPQIQVSGPALGTEMLWYDGSLLVYVPGGDFVMGQNVEVAPQDHPEHPEHVVTQSGFWIYRSEVTNGMYANCVADGGCTSPATDITSDYLNPLHTNHPVVGVDWYQAQAYCSWVDGHLPTESQWEKTARSPDGNAYPWGEDRPTCDLLNYNNCVGELLPSGTYISMTSPVLKYFEGASYYDAYDLAGNVFEWVQDWWQFDYYFESPLVDPPGPADGTTRVVRGSAFRSQASFVPSVLRDFFPPDEYRDDLGFRCVLEKPAYYAPACTYNPPQESCPSPTLDITDTYCQRRTGFVEFSVSEGATVNSAACAETTPDHYICSGASGGYVNVEVCDNCGPEEGDSCEPRQCAEGYVQNMETCKCVRQPQETEIDEGGVILYSPAQMVLDPCPPGRYWDELAQMCVPADNPNDCFAPTLMAVIPVECEECPPGSVFNEESGCCEPDGTLDTGLSATTVCDGYTLQLGTCNNPPPQTGCTNPSQYSDGASCQAAGCLWTRNPNVVTAVVYYCTNP